MSWVRHWLWRLAQPKDPGACSGSPWKLCDVCATPAYRTASIDAHLFRTHCPVHSGSGLGQVVTPKGVADVLSEAALGALEFSPFVSQEEIIRRIAASHRALALHCSEQEKRVAVAVQRADNLFDYLREAEEDREKAEARCVELETAPREIATYDPFEEWDDDDQRRIHDIARATLTPTVDPTPSEEVDAATPVPGVIGEDLARVSTSSEGASTVETEPES